MNLVWVDMEMSGLNPDSDRILEVAVVVTDARVAGGARFELHLPLLPETASP